MIISVNNSSLNCLKIGLQPTQSVLHYAKYFNVKPFNKKSSLKPLYDHACYQQDLKNKLYICFLDYLYYIYATFFFFPPPHAQKAIWSIFSQNLSTSYFVNVIKMHIQQIHLAALAYIFMKLLSLHSVFSSG